MTDSSKKEVENSTQENSSWILNKDNVDCILTISIFSQRLLLTLKDKDENRYPINTYSNSWSFGELITKNKYFQVFDDLTYVEDIIKSILDNPQKFSIEGESNDESIILHLQLPTRVNSDLQLELKLLEKSEEDKKLEEEKFEKKTKEKMHILEQGIFDLSVELKEIIDRNNIEWKVKELPPEILKRCREKWIKNHPNRAPPWISDTQKETEPKTH